MIKGFFISLTDDSPTPLVLSLKNLSTCSSNISDADPWRISIYTNHKFRFMCMWLPVLETVVARVPRKCDLLHGSKLQLYWSQEQLKLNFFLGLKFYWDKKLHKILWMSCSFLLRKLAQFSLVICVWSQNLEICNNFSGFFPNFCWLTAYFWWSI